MSYYRKFFSTMLVVWKHFLTTNIGAFTLQPTKGDILSERSDFSEKYPPPFLKLPARMQFRGRKGFTLIEVMMVIAIIGTLAAIAVPNYISYRERAYYTDTIQTMRTIEKEIIIFNLERGRFPNDLAEAGLDLLRDQWGNPFGYLNIENSPNNGMRRKNRNLVPINGDFDLYSMGPDGRSVAPLTARHSRDDIVRANNGAFLGRASDY
jgi:general secretion pathway protein G